MHALGVDLQRRKGRALADHLSDHSRRVVLTHSVRRQVTRLGRSSVQQRLALGHKLGAIGEAVAASVGVVADLDLLLDLPDAPAWLVEDDVRVDWLRLGIDEKEDAIGCGSDGAVRGDNVLVVEAVAVDEHYGLRAQRLWQALQADEHRLGRAARRARQLD